jgi:hypothetical protein
MKDENATQLLRELKIIRICAVTSTVVFVVAYVLHALGIRL